MSTKCTIKLGENFHLYFDGMADEIYLDLENTFFMAGNNFVTIKLPKEVIQAIKEAKELGK